MWLAYLSIWFIQECRLMSLWLFQFTDCIWKKEMLFITVEFITLKYILWPLKSDKTRLYFSPKIYCLTLHTRLVLWQLLKAKQHCWALVFFHLSNIYYNTVNTHSLIYLTNYMAVTIPVMVIQRWIRKKCPYLHGIYVLF